MVNFVKTVNPPDDTGLVIDGESGEVVQERSGAASLHTNSVSRNILAGAWKLIRVALFLVLYWLRLPVIFICNLISFPLLLAFLFSFFAFAEYPTMVWAFGVTSFVAFVIAWLYDYALMVLSPQEMIREL